MLITVTATSTSLASLIATAWITLSTKPVTDITLQIQNLWATDIHIEANRAAAVASSYKVVATTWTLTLNLWKLKSWKPATLLWNIFLISSASNADVRILENF